MARNPMSRQLGHQAISIEIDCREVMPRGGGDDGVAIHQVKIFGSDPLHSRRARGRRAKNWMFVVLKRVR